MSTKLNFTEACVVLANGNSKSDAVQQRAACRVVESHVAPLNVRKQRGFPSQLLSGVVALTLCQGEASVDLRLLAEVSTFPLLEILSYAKTMPCRC